MTKTYFFPTILVISIFALYVFLQFHKENNAILGSTTVSYTLNNKHLNLLVADTQEKWMSGLMDKRRLDEADGMIFIFPDSQPRSFWNKNTYVDLDIYWLDDDKVVGKSFLPSVEKTKDIVTVSSPTPVDKVVELVRKK